MSHIIESPIAPRSPRPAPGLPEERNPLLAEVNAESAVVKYQVIQRGVEEIIIGRVKIPTPGDGHAFMLRRFDTGAISVSAMVRAVFLTDVDATERRETTWVRTAFDCAGANGQGARRLAGVWAPLPVALHLAKDYGLDEIIVPLANASPDPKSVPRRSTRSSAATESGSLVTSPARAKTPPAKRRRAESPKSPGVPTASLNPSANSDLVVPTPRRSNRVSASPGRQTRSSESPARSQSARRSLRSPKPPTVPEVPDAEDELVPVIEGPDPVEDIEESKAIVAAVKKAAEESGTAGVITGVAVKRTHDEDTQLTLNIHHRTAAEGAELAVARPISSNRRIAMTPTRKAAAWGALAFSIGLGAAAFLPNFL